MILDVGEEQRDRSGRKHRGSIAPLEPGRRYFLPRQIERRILVQHRLVEVSQRLARLDPELVDECAPSLLVGGQRLGLTSAAVQDDDQ